MTSAAMNRFTEARYLRVAEKCLVSAAELRAEGDSFLAMGLPVVAKRFFDKADHENERAARLLQAIEDKTLLDSLVAGNA